MKQPVRASSTEGSTTLPAVHSLSPVSTSRVNSASGNRATVNTARVDG